MLATIVGGEFTEATAGNEADPDGTNGSYTFTVTLNKGAGTEQTTVTLTLVITATSVTPPPATVHVTAVTLDKTTLSLNVGETASLTATVQPENADNTCM